MRTRSKPGRPANLLHVRSHLERIERTLTTMLAANQKTIERGMPKGELLLPPLYFDELNSIRFLTNRILASHAQKKTRKDIYVEAASSTASDPTDFDPPARDRDRFPEER